MRSYLAVAGGLLLAGCGASEVPVTPSTEAPLSTGLTYARFKAQTYQEPDTGVFIVDGDVPLADEAQLREFYDQYVQPGALLIKTSSSGADVAWSSTQALNLTYCVSTALGADHDKVVEAMERAAIAWESEAQVSFTHDAGQDSNCNASNTAVLFDVRVGPSDAPYAARSFFPDNARAQRNLLIKPGTLAAGMRLLSSVLTHEMGHILGFRHEHIRVPGTGCGESSAWRALTPYDPNSIMHYTDCDGSTAAEKVLSGWDRHGVSEKYGRGPQTVKGDFDGDGREDLLIYRPGSNQAWVGWSNGVGSFTRGTNFISDSGFDFWSKADRVVVLDFNNDGRDDLFIYRPGGGPAYAVQGNANRTFTTTAAASVFAGFDFAEPQDRALAFDFNGDGFDDLFFYRPGTGIAFVAQSNGTGGFTNVVASFSGVGVFGLDSFRDRVLALDIDNDNKDELFLYRPGSGLVALARRNTAGNGFVTPFASGNGLVGFDFHDTEDRALVLDHNGDHRDDLLVYRPGSGLVRVAQSNGSDFDLGFASISGVGGFDLLDLRDRAVKLNINNDGKDDLFFYRPGSQAAYMMRSNAPGGFINVYGGLGIGGTWAYDFSKHQDQVVVYDHDNDGRDDLYTFRYDTQRVVSNTTTYGFAAFYPDPALNPY